MTAGTPSRRKGAGWIEARKSPRYDIWVSSTQVVSPYLYHPDCMRLWDEALGRPVTELDGQPGPAVRDEIAAAAAALREMPDVPWSRDAARQFEQLAHLCGFPDWTVRAGTVTVTSHYELVAGVMAGAITADDAVRHALAQGGKEADVRQELNMIKSAIDHEPALRARRN